MVATPSNLHQSPYHPSNLFISPSLRNTGSGFFLLGPRHFPQRIYRDLTSPQKEFIVCPDRTQLSVYRIRSKSFVHQGSNPFTNKFRIYIRWSQVSQHFFSKPLQFKNICPIVLNRTFGIVPLVQKIVKKRICQQHIATYLKSCNECMKKNSIIQRNLRIINLLLAEVVERKQHVLS